MKTGFLDKLMERMGRLDPESLQTHFLRIAQEKGLLETIFQCLQEGVIVLDGVARITYANRAAEQFLGFALDHARGKPIMRYLREIEWDRILDLDASEWLRLSSYEIEVRYPQYRLLNFYVVPLVVADRQERGAVIMLRDVTRDHADSANRMESERLNAIRMLAAGVAHEIGNPLNALNIQLQLLERELRRLPEDSREGVMDLVAVARNEVTRLDHILTQFLRAIRPSKPQMAPERIEVLLKEALALLQQEIENRRIRIELDCPEVIPSLRVDKDQIKQVFFNLIKNALQAMTDGGALTIATTMTDTFVAIAFHDTGTGIAPEDLSHVFEPYYTTKPDGTGLGLMIVQRIVQEHGGKIDIQSGSQSGTTVTILLPLDERRVRLLKPPVRGPRTAEEEASP